MTTCGSLSEEGANLQCVPKKRQCHQFAFHNNLELIQWGYTFQNRKLELQDLLLDIHSIWSFMDSIAVEQKTISYLLEDIYDYIKSAFQSNIVKPMPLYLERQFRNLIDKLRTIRICMEKFHVSGEQQLYYSELTKDVQKIFFTIRTLVVGLEKVLVSYGNSKMEKVWEVQNMV